MLTMTVLINHPKSLDGLFKIVGKRLLHQIRPVNVLLVSGPVIFLWFRVLALRIDLFLLFPKETRKLK